MQICVPVCFPRDKLLSVGLGRAGLGRVGQGWAGLGRVGQGRVKLHESQRQLNEGAWLVVLLTDWSMTWSEMRGVCTFHFMFSLSLS